ncbi:discoidin domain-containing protein [Psychrobacter sp. 1Y11]|uniref:discoidin domain-containing protein n=1 Tax=Psychrobacter sp. 1Y11 TaxID=3457446 RepID=UPI003FD0254F
MKLVNIAFFGKGTQSSRSKWSKPNESQLVLANNDFEFALHTQKEKNAWYQVDFPFDLKCYKIAIHNRRNSKFYFRNKNIKVFTSLDGIIWNVVYEGNDTFGFNENSLVIEFKIGHVFKYLKVINNDDYLHLSRLEVFVNKEDNKEVTLISHRKDGLTQRLIGIMNTIAVSRYCGFKFKFTWPLLNEDFHDVKSVEETFSKDFIEDFYLDSVKLNRGYKFIKYGDIFSTPDANKIIKKPVNYLEAYEKISFTPQIEDVLVKAQEVNLSNSSIAIHLRAGDIIYGYHRRSQACINKVLQYPFIIDILEKNKDKYVVLVGQDDKLMDYLKERYDNVILPKSFYLPEFSSIQKIFFDVEILSRCNKIFGGSSGPVLFASKIGNNEVVNLHETLNKEQKIKVLKKHLPFNLSEVPFGFKDKQIAYACSAYLYYGFNTESIEDLIRVNDLAMHFDPDLKLYNLFDLFLTYRFRAPEFAERNVRKYIEKYGSVENPILWFNFLYSKESPVFNSVSTQVGYLNDLLARVERFNNLPYANFLLGMSFYNLQQFERANKYFEVYLKEVVPLEASKVVEGFLNNISLKSKV